MSFVSYVEYMVYLGVVFAAGFVAGYFWNKVKEETNDIENHRN